MIVEAFAPLTAPQVVERLEAAQIANARVNTMHEVWAHPQLQARQRWRKSARPRARCPRCCRRDWRRGEARMEAMPALGQHTDALLAELGASPQDIERLRADGAI